MPCHCRRLPLALVIAGLFVPPAVAQDRNGGSLSYQDERSQVGIGVNQDGDIAGELKFLMSATPTSGLVAELWASSGAGGFKLSHNWIPADPDGRPDRAAAVRKLFGAVDQNDLDDRKVSLGGGLENETGYLAAYLSHSASGSRTLAPRQETSTTTVDGSEDGRSYTDIITRVTTLYAYEHPFDWGIGLRAGRHLREHGLRVGIGLDYEWGKNDTSLTTLSAELEKRFGASPWSLLARVEAAMSDDGVSDRQDDLRALLMVRYAFGEPPRTRTTYPVRNLASVPVSDASKTAVITSQIGADPVRAEQTAAWKTENRSEAAPAGPAPEVYKETTEKRIVKTTASMTADAYFKFDSARLTPLAHQSLDKVIEILTGPGYTDTIQVNGHTCDIGSEAYNLKLSQRRANSVKDYLVEKGKLPSAAIAAIGKGESQPLYPNVKGQRQKNRRVDIEFLTYVDKEEDYIVRTPVAGSAASATTPPTYRLDPGGDGAVVSVPAAEPEIVIQREEVEMEPAWIQHALFGTIPHKRSVDYYRVVSRTEETSRTERTWLNRSPNAANDSFNVGNGRATSLAVLANDSDPDGDPLTLTAVGQGSQGSVAISGNTVVYTPNSATATGTDSFNYSISDGHGGTATASVTVSLIANQAPMAVNDRYIIPGITSQLFNVLANDSDPEGDALSIISFTQPSHGTVSLENNRLRFDSTATFSALSFTYTISDTYGGTSSAVVTLIDP